MDISVLAHLAQDYSEKANGIELHAEADSNLKKNKELEVSGIAMPKWTW